MFLLRGIPTLLLLALLTGCAAHHPKTPPVITPVAIAGVDYLPVPALCDRYHAKLSWDRRAHTITVDVRGLQIRGEENSPLITLNGIPQRLTGPLVVYHRTLMAPSSVEQWLSLTGSPPAVTPAPLPPPPAPVPTNVNQMRRIMLDPGHGGHDPGAIGPNGVREKDVVLDVARRLRDKLAGRGVDVQMTRADDTFIPLTGRTRLANERRADLFVSIHANASRNRHVYGVEAYYLREKADGSAWAYAAAGGLPPPVDEGLMAGSSRTLKAIVWDLLHAERRREAVELGMRLCRSLREQAQTRSRGVRGARFQVLRTAAMPAVLIEVGYLTNQEEEARLGDPAYRDALAESLANGLLQYVQQYAQSDGFTR